MEYASGEMPEQVVVLLVWHANDDTDFPFGSFAEAGK